MFGEALIMGVLFGEAMGHAKLDLTT